MLRFLSNLWLYGTPIAAALAFLCHGHLLLALAALVALGWAWPYTVVMLFMVDRGWFVKRPEFMSAARIKSPKLLEGIYQLDANAAPNGVVQYIHKTWQVIGAAFPGRILVRDDITVDNTVFAHESKHTFDIAVWGPLFGPAYVGNSVVLWVRSKFNNGKRKDGSSINFYEDNWFEKTARKYAGEA